MKILLFPQIRHVEEIAVEVAKKNLEKTLAIGYSLNSNF
jgi:hypothetical protein